MYCQQEGGAFANSCLIVLDRGSVGGADFAQLRPRVPNPNQVHVAAYLQEQGK